MTAASAAAVEAAQKELGCEDDHARDFPYCLTHSRPWSLRGCPVAVRVADAVVEAQP